jgi:predicted outer membrane repeat protein
MQRSRMMITAVVLTMLLGSAGVAFAAEALDSVSLATTWWISTRGNDASSGSYSAPFATFQRAVDASSDGDVVIAKAGTYSGWKNYDVDCQGKSITIGSDRGAALTTIDLTEEGYRRFISFENGETAATKLIGFTILAGNAPNIGATGGGAILMKASAVVQDCVFVNNTAPGPGGAVSIWNASSVITPRFERCRFEGNRANGGWGGAIYAATNARPTFVDCEFVSNVAETGGAVFLNSTANATFTRCLFDGNGLVSTTSSTAGAIYVAGAAHIDQSTFVNNYAYIGSVLKIGGTAANLEFSRSMVTNNSSRAIWCTGTGETIDFSCSNFWNNGSILFWGTGGCNTGTIGDDNLFVNPLYCLDGGTEYTISSYSPCAAANSPCGETIGVGAEACSYLCGDMDYDGQIDISDLTYLVDFIFTGGPAPMPMEAGNIECGDGIDISDLVYLVDFMFTGGPAPCDCVEPLAKSNRYNFDLGATHESGMTTLQLDTPVDLAGLQIELAGDFTGEIETMVADGVRCFETRRNGNLVLSFVDLEGRAALPAGSLDIARFAGAATVTAATAIDQDGQQLAFALPSGETPVLGEARLNDVYPNPFNPMTTLSFTMYAERQANLSIFDIRGHKVIELLSKSLAAGDHEATWSGEDQRGNPVPAGVYFAQFQSGDYSESRKLIMVK